MAEKENSKSRRSDQKRMSVQSLSRYKRSQKTIRQKAKGRDRREEKPAGCLHCDSEGYLLTGDKVYSNRPDLSNRYFYKCPTCDDSIVGCHEESKRPYGLMANRETRQWRTRAHAEFDKHWQEKGMQRLLAYAILAKLMGMTIAECHIGRFTIDQCKQVIEHASR